MNIYDKAWGYVLENEGGYSEDQNDLGGATKYGISLRFLKGLPIDEGDINEDGKIDEKDIQVLSLEEAKEMYKKHFWLSASCDKIEPARIAVKLFDMSVNFGVKTAVRILQKIVGTKQDGIVGPQTLCSINTMHEIHQADLLKGLVNACIDRYRKIVEEKPGQRVFLKGWLKRAKRTPVV